MTSAPRMNQETSHRHQAGVPQMLSLIGAGLLPISLIKFLRQADTVIAVGEPAVSRPGMRPSSTTRTAGGGAIRLPARPPQGPEGPVNPVTAATTAKTPTRRKP